MFCEKNVLVNIQRAYVYDILKSNAFISVLNRLNV